MTTRRTINLFLVTLAGLLGLPVCLPAQGEPVTVTFDPLPAQCIDDTINCTAAVTYDFQVGVDCPFGQLQVDAFLNIFNDGSLIPITNALSGSYPAFSLSGEYPLGQHSFEVVVDDGCGNVQTTVLPFEVADCAVSTPLCVAGQVFEIVQVEIDEETGLPYEVQSYISYEDFLAQAVQDCTPPVSYSINVEGEAVDPEQDSILLDCEHDGTIVLELHAYDGAGNSSSCLTYFLGITQGSYPCEGNVPPLIAGAIQTEDGEPVTDVMVALTGDAAEDYLTQSDGAYVFNNLVQNGNYMVRPALNDAPLNGVSTLDLILISQHILGLQPLGSPYKRIAADTNGSGHITTLDIIKLRKLILGVDTGFGNVSSWRFVDASYLFPDPANPWAEAFPESISIQGLPVSSMVDGNFIAIKTGDVNGDAVAD
jgi:hypothetical protein